jgi:hypothetical protein
VDREPRIGSRLGTFLASRSACARPTGARALKHGQICVVATVTLELPESDVGCRVSLLMRLNLEGYRLIFRCEIKTVSAADAAALGTGASAARVLLAWLIARVTGHSSGCYPRSRVQNGSDPLL